MPSTPASLLERLRDPGQSEAWSRFVELYTPLLYTWARRLGVSPAEAGDLIQEVYLGLLQALPGFRYDPRHSFRAWLWTVTLNKWRQQRRRQPVAGADLAAHEPAVPDPLEAYEEAEYRQYLVQRALQLMRTDFQPNTWQAFWEVAAEGRPAADVAAELGLTTKAVYLAKARVMGRLRQELDGLLE
jgi:RNA polymerase sigma-70 factor (ECF subfamily)